MKTGIDSLINALNAEPTGRLIPGQEYRYTVIKPWLHSMLTEGEIVTFVSYQHGPQMVKVRKADGQECYLAMEEALLPMGEDTRAEWNTLCDQYNISTDPEMRRKFARALIELSDSGIGHLVISPEWRPIIGQAAAE